jgi:hypothetical protein
MLIDALLWDVVHTIERHYKSKYRTQLEDIIRPEYYIYAKLTNKVILSGRLDYAIFVNEKVTYTVL